MSRSDSTALEITGTTPGVMLTQEEKRDPHTAFCNRYKPPKTEGNDSPVGTDDLCIDPETVVVTRQEAEERIEAELRR